ncbi:MAG TPA: non-homologous end-joining DNA ligase [Solirubrobacterales bacterium]|jgi:bifunctional non-homologous end joining protein LigD
MASGEQIPRDLEPMLARPAKALPTGDGWAYEIKWDGIRALTYVEPEGLRIAARRGADHTPRYPELAAIVDALQGREAILDGEIVAFDESGRPSFQLLQRRMGLSNEATIRIRASETPATYVAFDLLWLDGRSLLAEPYLARRELLTGLGFDGPNWQAPAHHLGDGERLWDAIREQGLEGVVAKRIDSPYRPGQRSGEWLKIRYRRGQELVIGGWMPGEGSRGGRVGSLLVGYWDATPEEAERLGRPQRLVYAGGVGTGFTQEMLDRLTELLKPLERADSPFELGEDPVVKYAQRARDRGAGPVWVEPRLVAEVEFTEWTREGTLRQSAFKGLRDDKDPHQVVRES